MPLLTDRLFLQPSLRCLGVLGYFLFLTHICKASDATSCPVLRLLGIAGNGGVDLNCVSKGWQEEAQVIWLDGEGNLLSAGPTETVRGSDGLYTVSSRVTVEKRHHNCFTCRVQQNHPSQTREAQIYIADDFFDIRSSSSSTTFGLAAGLAVCIVVILGGFIVWNYKTKRSCRDQTTERENENHSQSNRSEDRVVTGEERETQLLMTPKNNCIPVQLEVLNEEEQLRREANEKARETLEAELETKKTELRKKRSYLQQLDEEKQKKEENMKKLKEQLENKKTEVHAIICICICFLLIDNSSEGIRSCTGPILEDLFITCLYMIQSSEKKEHQQKKAKAETEVENREKQLETEQMELATKTKQINDKQAEVQQLQEEIQKMETNLQSLMEQLESRHVKVE
ncbi:coiled-coil domain-containing protein 110-like [Acanthopagrus latus]|uniref:coiled-coil domain-containing protein 110-like n=1 Tax=Acanthopagrus latus TaxID=8177 RepID=UPI00187BC845|nr:coiled-coil domain-containing protein 110-like [Acanthopagrus latus]